ncbi:WD40/YVTN/BNR-like repeat-containing protein [Halocatena pleomorpha]|uniref:Glycosyl hydrolase n=1 Tax=Halocatena pleomorpha TaxID=1785090 RepID=A0A3P3RL78_9EURY|nr:glycosyl hydrolase [Halocatena pleomorpha]RRJ33648.1 glycosyl hydrolase [Halocatena pleomorpha]
MKLQSISNGRVYASRGRTVFSGPPGRLEPLSRLPNPLAGVSGLRYAVTTTPPWRSVVEWAVGAYQTTNVWPITESVLVATVRRQLFASHDGGRTWLHTHRLPPSSGVAGVLPTAVCAHRGAIYLGEYPLDDDATPRILRSVDAGRTWSPVLELPDVRHIHTICSDPYTGELWVTTGDRDPECYIGRLREGQLEPVGGGSQRWRAVALVFTPSAVLWGMDCVYSDRNPIFRLDRADINEESTRPTPGVDSRSPTAERSPSNCGGHPALDTSPSLTSVGVVPNSVYFGTTLTVDDTPWVVFSTAAETGGDSTAPNRDHTDEARTKSEHKTATVIAASARTEYTDWYELARFRTPTRLIKRVDPGGWVPTANTYVFLGADADHGLIINPFNTATDHGRLITVSPETIARVAESQSR